MPRVTWYSPIYTLEYLHHAYKYTHIRHMSTAFHPCSNTGCDPEDCSDTESDSEVAWRPDFSEDTTDWNLPQSQTHLPATPFTEWAFGKVLSATAFTRLGARADVSAAVHNGIDLGFLSTPDRFHGKNYASAIEHGAAVSKEIERLAAAGKVEPVTHTPFMVHSLGAVAKKGSDKVRVILDCSKSGLNACLPSPPMRLPTVRHAARLMKQGWYAAKYDLKDGFLQIPVRSNQVDFLGFQHPVTGQFFRYRYMCFGISCAPFIFQSFMTDLKRLATERGITAAIVYIDDWFLCAPTMEACKKQMEIFEQLLTELGWQVNPAKIEGPSQRIEFLGMTLDSSECTLSIPESKIEKTRTRIADLLCEVASSATNTVLAKNLASAVGMLTHLSAISPQGGLRLRAAWKAVAAASSISTWSKGTPWGIQTAVVTDDILSDLLWWDAHVASGPRRRLWPTSRGFLDTWSADLVPSAFHLPPFCTVITTDAAGVGWGATLFGSSRWAGVWSELQATCSSNWRELKAVYLALLLYAPQLEGHRVLVRVDNACAVTYVNKKHGRSQRLCEIAQDVVNLERKFNFETAAVHIPGALNTEADELSRLSQALYAKRTLCDSVINHLSSRIRHTLQPVMSVDESSLSLLDDAPHIARLWCPGPHEFFSCINAVRKATYSRGRSAPQVLLIPRTEHATWWSLVKTATLVQEYASNTKMFTSNLRLAVPQSAAPELVIPSHTSCPWFAITFSKAAMKRGRGVLA